MSDIKITDNSKEVLSAFENQIRLALESIGQTAEGYAKEDCPVGTPESTGKKGYIGGTLRGSISNDFGEEGNGVYAVYIGTNVDYAIYVEMRDSVHHQTGKAHFLRDACATHADEYKAISETFLKG